jgi:hypothetical protein
MPRNRFGVKYHMSTKFVMVLMVRASYIEFQNVKLLNIDMANLKLMNGKLN